VYLPVLNLMATSQWLAGLTKTWFAGSTIVAFAAELNCESFK
jgi:hypothetical protein